MKQIAIIAPTASGKTALSLSLAHKTNSIILSLDSLAIYKEIDIASAKPTLEQREGIVHFGIDQIYPNESFDVMKFISLYKQAKEYALTHNKNLIIVGGTSFYLKSMIDGISYIPPITQEMQHKLNHKFNTNSLEDIYKELYALDSTYMKEIKQNDKYRIEKAFSIYIQTNTIPSKYFFDNKAISIIENIKLYEILWDSELLRQRIQKRTQMMLNDGLIDEVIYLEKKYTRIDNCMSSIGIKESLDYIDGKIDKKQLHTSISIATAQLAKRQRTFNKNQFKDVVRLPLQDMEDKILSDF
jgi:tRNA dimethylallyltransferase